MPSVSDLLGASVLKGSETVPTASFSGEGKVVGLYFSAHWCPPCRGFTPKLAEWYTKFCKTDKGKNFEVVFVSSDRDEDSFKEYYATMPWLAVPFSDRSRKEKLSKKFKVKGIPTFVIIDGTTGKIITDDGRSKVEKDPDCKEFPWHPKPLSDLMKGELMKGKDERVDFSTAVKGKVWGLYFSAHWCPPCKEFTPKLVETYKKLKEDNKNFECIFASWDQTETQFEEYYATMPFLSFPYEDDRIQAFGDHFGVEGIPNLVILDENNEVITELGRGAVSEDPEGKEFPWHPKPLDELSGGTGNVINDKAVLLLLGGGGAEWKEKSQTLLQDVAKDYIAKQKASEDTANELPELAFLYEGPNTKDLSKSLRQFASLTDRTPLVVIIDITEKRKYEYPEVEEELGKENIAQIVDKFQDGTLEWTGLQE